MRRFGENDRSVRTEPCRKIRTGDFMREKVVLEILAADYPQLFLNPDRDEQESCRRVVLRGEESGKRSILLPVRYGWSRWVIAGISSLSCAL